MKVLVPSSKDVKVKVFYNGDYVEVSHMNPLKVDPKNLSNEMKVLLERGILVEFEELNEVKNKEGVTSKKRGRRKRS